MTKNMRRNVGIFIFDNVEVLDFAGPFEVFGITGQRTGEGNFRVFTVAEKAGPVRAVNGLSINPDYSFADTPSMEIVVIPGGMGTRPLLKNEAVLEWVRKANSQAELTLSVCSGALVLARAGLLDNKEATTHHGCLDLLQEISPSVTVHADRRFLDNGNIITSAGISAGIDMSLYVIARLLGREQARETARYMEYVWQEVL